MYTIFQPRFPFVALALCAIMATSCDLQIAPVSNPSELTISTTDTAGSQIKYKDRAAIQAVYLKLYDYMRDNQEYWYLDYLLFSEARTDNAYAGTTGAEVVPVETNALDASNPDIARDWNGYLNDIAHANAVIANIDLVPDPSFSQQERAQWKAEALIFRAMMIFDLARWFGNIPLNLTEAPDITADNIEQVYPLYFPSPVSQDSAYAQVIADLTAAIPYAPSLNASDKRILSKTVARALLAKVYAELGDWDNVIYYANEVFADGIDLEPRYEDLFGYNATTNDATLRNSRETILEMQYTAASGNWVTWMFGRNLSNWDESFTWAKWITPSRDLINAFAAAGDTLRCRQTIVYYDCAWQNYYPADHYPFMYKTRSAYNSIIKLRGADILLLKAEALAHKGDLAAAVEIVNTTRRRAKLADLSLSDVATQEQVLSAVLNERRLELALEGHRLFDLIRFDQLLSTMNGINLRDEGRLPQARPFVPAHRLMPIPQTALDQNANLQQNEGY